MSTLKLSKKPTEQVATTAGKKPVRRADPSKRDRTAPPKPFVRTEPVKTEQMIELPAKRMDQPSSKASQRNHRYDGSLRDEAPRPQTTMEGLAGLKTPFRPAGRVTPGNSSGLNDGATAALLASEEKALELGLTIKAKMVTFAFAGVEPEIMGYGPVPSTIKALKQAGLTIEDIGAFEINEAFAAVSVASMQSLGVAPDKVNVHGGAIAVGHPVGASGARIVGHLVRSLNQLGAGRKGAIGICGGGGQGVGIIIESLGGN